MQHFEIKFWCSKLNEREFVDDKFTQCAFSCNLKRNCRRGITPLVVPIVDMPFVFSAMIVFGATVKRLGRRLISARLVRTLVWTARTHFNPLISRLTDTRRVVGKFLYQGREGARNAIPQRLRCRSAS